MIYTVILRVSHFQVKVVKMSLQAKEGHFSE
jgi:hypothetical protein